jgi:hypothetical protein
MPAPTIEELAARVDALEKEVGRLARKGMSPRKKDWRNIVGRFKDDDVMKEIMALGKAIRDAERPDDSP